MFIKEIYSKIIKQWKNNWPDYIIQFLILGLILWGFITILEDSLKPKTDIQIDYSIEKLQNVSADYKLNIIFNNKADFAGEDFYIYVWGITSNSWGSSHSTSEHCVRKKDIEIDWKSRFKIYCDFIPPKSNFGFGIDFEFNERAQNLTMISIEYWGKTTPYDKKWINVSEYL